MDTMTPQDWTLDNKPVRYNWYEDD